MVRVRCWRHRNRLADFAEHGVVNHATGECVRGIAPTNTVEGYFSIFKRGEGCLSALLGEALHRYLAEFDFPYNNRVSRGVNDEACATRMVKGVVGKRFTYQTIDERGE